MNRRIDHMKVVKIQVGDVVTVNPSRAVAKITAIQYEFNRYQLKNVSNWQYGIDKLVKQSVDSLITTIESLEARIVIKDQALEGARDMFNQYVAKRNEHSESQKEEIESLKRRIRFGDIANSETGGR
jgi:hypothetical protein